MRATKMISFTIRNWIIFILNFFKLLPITISYFLSIILLFFDYSQHQSLISLLFLFSLTILSTFLYFYIVYYFIDAKSLYKISKDFILFFNYYKNKGKKYFSKQWRDILIEEMLFKYIPFFILSEFIDLNIFVLIIFTGILFSFIHKFNSPFSYIEFFLFFGVSHFLFIKTKSFMVLFIPHLIRNLIIEYILRHD